MYEETLLFVNHFYSLKWLRLKSTFQHIKSYNVVKIKVQIAERANAIFFIRMPCDLASFLCSRLTFFYSTSRECIIFLKRKYEVHDLSI